MKNETLAVKKTYQHMIRCDALRNVIGTFLIVAMFLDGYKLYPFITSDFQSGLGFSFGLVVLVWVGFCVTAVLTIRLQKMTDRKLSTPFEIIITNVYAASVVTVSVFVAILIGMYQLDATNSFILASLILIVGYIVIVCLELIWIKKFVSVLKNSCE